MIVSFLHVFHCPFMVDGKKHSPVSVSQLNRRSLQSGCQIDDDICVVWYRQHCCLNLSNAVALDVIDGEFQERAAAIAQDCKLSK